MYLEKLEIHGFKSFAQKTVLAFPGMLPDAKQGLTGIVGPNGSGKSNISDAVRWVLGEQSLKSLRGKKAEDVIFAGTEKKGQLGMAEVSLFLNNSEKKAPIDYTNLVITRRIYRDGNSEYLLNNTKVRLLDVQMLLAKANVGQKTYSVVGQGTVDGFLNSSLADRKEFFDEATGVKQYQIKRDASLNKLRSSYDNLVQAQMLLAEIEPRLASLTRQVNKLRKRGDLEKELRALQLVHYSNLWHANNDKLREYNQAFLELENIKQDKDNKLNSLNKELEKFEAVTNEENEYEQLQRDLNKEMSVKGNLERELARVNAQLEVRLEAAGKFDLSFLLTKKEEIAKELKVVNEEMISLGNSVSHDTGQGEELYLELKKQEEKIKEQNKIIIEVGRSNQQTPPKHIISLNERFDEVLKKLNVAKELNELTVIREILAEIYQEVEEIFNESRGKSQNHIQETASVNENWQAAHLDLQNLIDEKEAIIVRINENNLRIGARTERVKLLKEKVGSMESELKMVESKIKQNSEHFDFEGVKEEQDKLRVNIDKIEETVLALKNRIGKISREEEEKRKKLLALQKDIHEAQMEINSLGARLNETSIQAARFETRLESLEAEIRDELQGLKEIKDGTHLDQAMSENVLKEKINQIKKQLETIGGIDPQIEDEYKETKDRYDYLKEQADDLDKAIDSLEKIIIELDKTIKEKFDREFNLIAKKFEEYFKILFNGGTAKIEKVIEDFEEKSVVDEVQTELNEDGVEVAVKKEKVKNVSGVSAGFADPQKIKFLQKHNSTGLAGIEINACPPGKKISSVSMLSGGEKALTAIALISAIISNNPSPFVFLDEVDAALDEANSERLAKILDDLADKTQFIVITHNRASMKRASVLYGVTMGDDGVSKLLSVKIDDVVNKARY
ncbi:AAA family ATPase [Candidatus Parcubacteria bacterium]|nr:AAA family ATPase [Patescibacteria group bacterium]MBU4309559.1 AAA family ATPase [Patescibacteria group bacterium]MBU4432345.1 AAA family ATPase [Patescibacteria group bacterium]MBU4578053.1 AAA family ATPase [Patescibacteria group bacterium]MCG2696439.1 AAA family ATPase [Candidatus Parcubacteria bacterium]